MSLRSLRLPPLWTLARGLALALAAGCASGGVRRRPPRRRGGSLRGPGRDHDPGDDGRPRTDRPLGLLHGVRGGPRADAGRDARRLDPGRRPGRDPGRLGRSPPGKPVRLLLRRRRARRGPSAHCRHEPSPLRRGGRRQPRVQLRHPRARARDRRSGVSVPGGQCLCGGHRLDGVPAVRGRRAPGGAGRDPGPDDPRVDDLGPRERRGEARVPGHRRVGAPLLAGARAPERRPDRGHALGARSRLLLRRSRDRRAPRGRGRRARRGAAGARGDLPRPQPPRRPSRHRGGRARHAGRALGGSAGRRSARARAGGGRMAGRRALLYRPPDRRRPGTPGAHGGDAPLPRAGRRVRGRHDRLHAGHVVGGGRAR